jgi:hypothetical protein
LRHNRFIPFTPYLDVGKQAGITRAAAKETTPGAAKAGSAGSAASAFFNCYEVIAIGSDRLVGWPGFAKRRQREARPCCSYCLSAQGPRTTSPGDVTDDSHGYTSPIGEVMAVRPGDTAAASQVDG